jgi:hypothetical protein
MNILQKRSVLVALSLLGLMLATRYNHFGSAVALPDASLAIFFIGGLFLANWRAAGAWLALLIVAAGAIDYYATTLQGVSDWCITPAYAFLIPIYAGLWFAGRWFALNRRLQGRGLLELLACAWAANSAAFVLSNASFYLFSGRYAEMSALEYASRVSQYYGSYVSVALFYLFCAVGVRLLFSRILQSRVA